MGRWAEAKAAIMLLLKGYRILARGFRVRHPGAGEIDIVARRGRVVAFVEVKARHGEAAAAEALSKTQQDRIAVAAGAFMQTRPEFAHCDWRFDAILVRPWHRPRHIPDAWRPGDP